MKNFKDFNLSVEELLIPYFNNPKIIAEEYIEGDDDDYDNWHFIIESSEEKYLVSFTNPDNGDNSYQKFSVKHIHNFTNELKIEFMLNPYNFEFKEDVFSCRLDIENSEEINVYQQTKHWKAIEDNVPSIADGGTTEN